MLDTSELMEAIGGPSQEPEKDIIERLRFDEALEIPVEITDLELWANYTNDDLYAMDKKVREFIKKTRYRKEKNGNYKTTASMVFAWIYGRQPTPHDGSACRILHMLLKYYCSSYTGPTTFGGKKVNRVYKFTKYGATCRRPYSLRLRLEEAKPTDAVWRRDPLAGKDKQQHGRRAD